MPGDNRACEAVSRHGLGNSFDCDVIRPSEQVLNFNFYLHVVRLRRFHDALHADLDS